MANTAQTDPIFTKNADIVTGLTIDTANTAKDGTGTVVEIFSATKSISTITSSGTVATVTLLLPHNFLNGEEVMIQGVNESGYNGIQTITVTSPLVFTYPVDSGLTTPATGTITCAPINGTLIEKLVFQPLGTNVATVARAFLNNGLTNATATNNTYIKDVSLLGSTLDETATMALTEMTLDLVIPPFHVLNLTIGTTVAAGYSVYAVVGNY